MFEDSFVQYSVNNELLEMFKSSSVYYNLLNWEPSSCENIDLSCEYSLYYEFVEKGYETDNIKTPVVDGIRLSLYCNSKSLVAEIMILAELVEKLEENITAKCLFILLCNVIDGRDDDINFVHECIPWLFFVDFRILNMTCLSGNMVSTSDNLSIIYDKLTEDPVITSNWDIIITHFGEKTRMFVNDSCEKGEYYQAFIKRLVIENAWDEKKNIWLWACNAGYRGEDKPAVAQEIAEQTGVCIKTAPGVIVVFNKHIFKNYEDDFIGSDIGYYIVDLHDTEWYNIDIGILSEYDQLRYIKFIQEHHIPRGEEWVYFQGV